MIEKNINEYINGLIENQSGHLKIIKDNSIKASIPIIDDDVARILVQLIAMNNVESILEIGTATGYSGSLMLNQRDNIKLTTIEVDEARIERAKENFKFIGYENRVDILQGDAGQVLENINEKFDLIFIDGPKSHYMEYFNKSLKLLEEDGLIVCDNVLFRGYLVEDNPPKRFKTIIKRLREFNKYIMEDERFISTLLPVGDGLTITIKR